MTKPPRTRPSRPTCTRRGPLLLERLEERTLLAGNLLIDAQVPGVLAYNLMQYTQQGALVSSQPVTAAPGGDLAARGLSVGPSGNVNIYDGTFTPYLATYAPATNSFSYQTFPGWSTVNNVSYGEVAAYKTFVFASDMFTFGGGEPNGIVRFDSAGSGTVRFASGNDFIQVALGQDGVLYGLLGGGTVKAYDPDTLAPGRTFTLQGGPDSDIRSIAVDPSGQILAATWGGYLAKYDATGHYLASTQLKGQFGFGENLINVALDTDGQVAVGGRFGEIYLTDETLASVQTIQTNQWNTFVTFDHYIGTAQQVVTPTFASLAGPAITYGQASVTLGGQITAGAAVPSGSVNITVAGVTKSAAINQADGTFSANFDTSTLGVSGSPYAITYSYPGDAHDAAIQDTSKSLTVTQAVTSLGDLVSPTVVIGTSAVTLSGVIDSNSVLPTGQAVTVTVVGAHGPVATGSGVIASDGTFSATLDISALAVGSYTMQYAYAGDANFAMSSGTGMLTVTYAVIPLYDTSKPVHAGAALPIQLQITDASGNDLSDLTATAVALVDVNGNAFTPRAKGQANPDNVFRKVGSGYQYNLDTTGLAAGTYTLLVRVGNDPVLHGVSFVIA
jgi:hypothetical protein